MLKFAQLSSILLTTTTISQPQTFLHSIVIYAFKPNFASKQSRIVSEYRRRMEPIQVYVKESEATFSAPKSPTADVLAPSSPKFPTSNQDLFRSSLRSPPPPLSQHQQPLGACTFCHHLLMLLNLKRHILGDDKFRFEVHRINVSRAPPEFRQNCLRNVPAIVDANTDTASDHELEIFEYLETQYPTPQLCANDDEADNVRVLKICSELFKRFNHYIKSCSREDTQLIASLRALNEYLEKKGTQFVFGATITTFDAELMPKLHQLRIACAYIRRLEIPVEFRGIWRYLYRAYHCPAFVEWMPSDQEIVIAWTAKAALETPSMRLSFEEKKRLIKSELTFTLTMPNDQLLKAFSDYVV